MVHGRPFLFRIPTKETVVVFYSTLSPQKCTKINKKQQHAQGHLGSNLTPKRENRNFRKTVVTNSTNCYHQQHKLLSPTAQTVITNSTNCYHQQHKLLSPTAQTVITSSTNPLCRPSGHQSWQYHEGWCHSKIHQKSYRKKRRLGSYLTPGGRLRVKQINQIYQNIKF